MYHAVWYHHFPIPFIENEYFFAIKYCLVSVMAEMFQLTARICEDPEKYVLSVLQSVGPVWRVVLYRLM